MTAEITKPLTAQEAMTLGVEMVSIHAIDPSPYQTRKRFEVESLRTLAASLAVHGQLQNLIVREVGDRYELIAGERRWRAAQMANLEMMKCLVIEANDDHARELVIIENLERENVSAVEEASGFQQLIESGQYTQKTLAERLHRDPSFISNRIRLLSLPEEWRQQLIDGTLLPTQARLLVPWADRPAVLESVRKRLDNMVDLTTEQPMQIVDMSCDVFEELVIGVAKSCSRSMQTGYWDGPKFEVTDEIQQQLDIADVQEWNGKKPRAFNVELWDKLQAEAVAAAGQRKPQSNSGSDADDADDADTDDSDADVRSTESLVSRLNDYSVTRHICRHVSSVVAGHIKADTIGLRTFMMIMADDGGYAFGMWLLQSQQMDVDDIHDDRVMWDALKVLNQKNILTQMALFLQDRLADDSKGPLMTLEQLLLLCREMQLDPMAKWVPDLEADAELLDLCSDSQLREILIDHIAPEKQVKKWKRARMLKEALSGWPPGYLPMLLTPKVMLEATSEAQSDQ